MSFQDIKITVAIPVGSKEHHQKWLIECINSVLDQCTLPDEILLIDDQANINTNDYLHLDGISISDRFVYRYSDGEFSDKHYYKTDILSDIKFSIWKSPCVLGVPAVFNLGIALADNEYILQLGSDDLLDRTAISEAVACIARCDDKRGMYNFSCKTIGDGEEEQFNWYNHANVMSKTLWREVGGYHPFASIGGADAAFNSICMKHLPDRMHKIAEGVPLYNVRQHDGQYTKESASRYGSFMDVIRNDLTREWKPNNG